MAMHALTFLSACMLLSYFSLECPTASTQGFFASAFKALVEQDGNEEKSALTDEGNQKEIVQPEKTGKVDQSSLSSDLEEENFDYGDEDFEDDEDAFDLSGLHSHNLNSLTHLHNKGGEILVPCFGMWWPVGGGGGGGGGYYDYGGGDYYYTDDYKKKRRRARKRKKARMKKKRKKA